MIQLSHKARKWMKRAAATVVGGFLLLVIGFMSLDALFPPDLARYQATSFEVRAKDNSLLRLYPVENGRLRSRATLAEVDPLFIDMLLAYEDKRYFDHSGVDFLAVGRAAWQALTSGEVVSGASTLTMQVARLLEPRPRTLSAKIIEMFRAIQLEHHFSKKQILEMYLTLAPYGGNIEGIRAASLVYFGHETKHMTPEEAALLVVLPQAPTRMRPDRHPAAAIAGRNKVLARVQPILGLDPHLTDLAKQAPLPDSKVSIPLLAAHLSDKMRRRGQNVTSAITTIDPTLQKKLEQLAARAAEKTHSRASTAILVVDNKTRDVMAYVGSADYMDRTRDGFVDMVGAVRSPGSTLKPFIFGMAFERGMLHPLTRIRDEARQFGTYAPTNFGDRFHGEISAADALRRSLNVPAVAVLDRLGPVQFTAALRQAGATIHLPGEEKPGLAVALGGLGVSLEDLVMLYAALADDGTVRPLGYLRDAKPQAADPQQAGHKFLDADTRQTLTAILATIGAPGDRLPKQYQKNPRHIAFKTGTSYGFRDALAIGYDGRFTVGVWVGRPDGTPLPGRYGTNTAAPVLFDTFDALPMGDNVPVRADMTAFRDLPPVLKYFDNPQVAKAAHKSTPLTLAFPVAESVLEIGQGATPVSLEATGGQLPLQWFVDGKPLPKKRWSRAQTLMLESEGFYRVSVVDRNGNRVGAAFMARRGG